jgi:ketosteroid isomerase-like protein
MKNCATLIIASLALWLAPQCVAQQQAPMTPAELREQAKENDAKQDELVNLENEMARAMQWNNGTIFRRVYGEDFVGVLPSGQLLNKAAWIAAMENSGIKYTAFVASDIRVRMFEDMAVVTCIWSARGTQGGRNFYRQFRVTHVYIYGQRGWQAVAEQQTLLPG